jgi:hypothetical protein
VAEWFFAGFTRVIGTETNEEEKRVKADLMSDETKIKRFCAASH